MVQVVENHRMLLDTPAYQMALAHSIGGPINNNVGDLTRKDGSSRAASTVAVSPQVVTRAGRDEAARHVTGNIVC